MEASAGAPFQSREGSGEEPVVSAGNPAISSRILNLGSGRKVVAGAVNIDRAPDLGADVIHDLDKFPWPLPSNHFHEVLANDVIEHLGNVMEVFTEIHRICGDGAVVRLTVPHFTCANSFTDPTHRHHFGFFSFDYLTGDNELSYYSSVRFRKRSVQLIFYPSMVNKIVWRLANRYPEAWERRWAWIFPAWFLNVELEVVKPASP